MASQVTEWQREDSWLRLYHLCRMLGYKPELGASRAPVELLEDWVVELARDAGRHVPPDYDPRFRGVATDDEDDDDTMTEGGE